MCGETVRLAGSSAELLDCGMLPIPRTSPERYITGNAVLNLTDPEHPAGGDWHQSMWMDVRGAAKAVEDFGLLSCPEADREIMALFGACELRDYRESLREMGHPAGDRDEPVWGCSHVRAVIEEAWRLSLSSAEDDAGRGRFLLQFLDAQTVGRWLADPLQWFAFDRWARRVERTSCASPRHGGGVAGVARPHDAVWGLPLYPDRRFSLEVRGSCACLGRGGVGIAACLAAARSTFSSGSPGAD